MRKYYTLTEAGSHALVEARHKIKELVDEVLAGQGPTTLADLPDSGQGDADG